MKGCSEKKNYFGTEGTCQIVVGRPPKKRLCGPPLHYFWCFRAPTTLWGPSEACGCAQSCSPSHKGAIRGCFWGSGVNSGVNLGVPGETLGVNCRLIGAYFAIVSPTKSPTKPTHTHSVFCVGMGAYGAHCVMFAPPHRSPMESSIDSTSWNSIMDSEFESMDRFGFESTMPHASTSFEYGCCMLLNLVLL